MHGERCPASKKPQSLLTTSSIHYHLPIFNRSCNAIYSQFPFNICNFVNSCSPFFSCQSGQKASLVQCETMNQKKLAKYKFTKVLQFGFSILRIPSFFYISMWPSQQFITKYPCCLSIMHLLSKHINHNQLKANLPQLSGKFFLCTFSFYIILNASGVLFQFNEDIINIQFWMH